MAMLMRWDPFREFDRLNEQLWGQAQRGAVQSFPMDAYRRGDRFYVHFDLPGVDADQVEITVEKNVLSVTAQRAWQPHEGDEVTAAERPRGTFTRQLFLGDTLDSDHLEASYEKGVLTLTIPVAESAKPRKIQVSVGDAGSTAIEAEHTAN